MLYPFTTYQSAHITSLSDFTIIRHFHSPYKCVAFSCSASSLPNITGPVPMPTVSGRLFRCTGMEAAEMCHRWECRRREELCVWRDAQRKKRVGCRDVYKGELRGAQSTARSDSHTLCDFTAEFQSEEQSRISQIISHQAEPSGLNIKQLSLIEYCISYFY